ncbi:hypothetical protein GCM10022382_16570 [Microbacterium invictum]
MRVDGTAVPIEMMRAAMVILHHIRVDPSPSCAETAGALRTLPMPARRDRPPGATPPGRSGWVTGALVVGLAPTALSRVCGEIFVAGSAARYGQTRTLRPSKVTTSPSWS